MIFQRKKQHPPLGIAQHQSPGPRAEIAILDDRSVPVELRDPTPRFPSGVSPTL
jgi:hypothetical protein